MITLLRLLASADSAKNFSVDVAIVDMISLDLPDQL